MTLVQFVTIMFHEGEYLHNSDWLTEIVIITNMVLYQRRTKMESKKGAWTYARGMANVQHPPYQHRCEKDNEGLQIYSGASRQT